MTLRRDWAESFDGGGSLLDIVVAAMTPTDWNTVLDYFRRHPHIWQPCDNMAPAAQLPATHAAIDPDRHSLLARGDLPGQLCARFLHDELEINLDPRLITSDDHVIALHQLMRDLGRMLGRDIVMSWDGSRSAVEFRYRHATDMIERTPQG